jgi:hypothetical protein
MDAAPSRPMKAIARNSIEIPLQAGRILQKTWISFAARDNLAQVGWNR